MVIMLILPVLRLFQLFFKIASSGTTTTIGNSNSQNKQHFATTGETRTALTRTKNHRRHNGPLHHHHRLQHHDHHQHHQHHHHHRHHQHDRHRHTTHHPTTTATATIATASILTTTAAPPPHVPPTARTNYNNLVPTRKPLRNETQKTQNISTDNIQQTTDNRQRTTYNIQHTTCNMQHITYNTQHTSSNIQHATCNIQQRFKKKYNSLSGARMTVQPHRVKHEKCNILVQHIRTTYYNKSIFFNGLVSRQ